MIPRGVRRGVLLALTVGPVAFPATATCQNTGSSDSASVSAFVEPVMRATALHGGLSFLAGGGAGIAVAGRILLGGAGYGLLRDVDVDTPDSGLELGFGYGGILVEVPLRRRRSVQYSVSTLLGAGSADVKNVFVGTELGSDNFLVFEPEAVMRARIRSRLEGGVSAGFRFVAGVDDLPGIVASDLGGLTGSLFLRIGPFD